MRKLTVILGIALTLVGCKGKEQPVTPPAAAPALVGTSPENGVKDIDATTLAIRLLFDQNVKCPSTEGITIDGGATVNKVHAPADYVEINVSGLTSDKTYTVTVPSGAIQGFKENQQPFAGTKFTFSTKPGPPGPMKPGKADDGWENAALAVKNMKYGWNLGNTLDSNGAWIPAGSSVDKYETAWGQPVTKPELMKMFAGEGFGAIRVPVTWYQHMDADGNVDEAWMNRVEQIVGYVLDAGMYCIVNVHHDTGADSGDFKAWLHADLNVYAAVKDRYIKLWKQIATRFKDYDQKLLFESFNEMLDAANTWNDPSRPSAYDAINNYNSDFVGTVRATGGNNAHRNLIVNTYGAGNTPGTLGAFVLPSDPAKDHLIAQVHSYSPYLFAFDVTSGQITKWDSNCEKEIKDQMDRLNKYLVNEGIPCIIGEYGCTAKQTQGEMAAQAASYITNAGKYDIACFYWMNLSDGGDRSVPKWTMPTVKDAIKNAYSSINKQ